MAAIEPVTGAAEPVPGAAEPVPGAAEPVPGAAEPVPGAVSRAGTVNVANGLTLVRLALVPVFVVMLAAHGGHSHGWRIAAAVTFAVAAATDRFDGQLARSRGLVTTFGTLADPIADKALTGAALIGLSVLGNLTWWVTVVVLVREVGITVLRFVVIRHGVMPASRGGKLKTLLQGVAILLYLLPLTGAAGTTRAIIMTVAVAVTVVTGVDYVGRAVHLSRSSVVPTS